MTVRSDRWHRNVAAAQTLAFVFIIAIGAAAFYQDGQRAQDIADAQAKVAAAQVKIADTQAEICDRAAENRQATRNLVIAIYTLGANLVMEDAGSPPTREQKQALEDFAAFRDAQLALLDDPIC